MRREAGLDGIQQRVDGGRRQRLGFALENFGKVLIGLGGAVAFADGTGDGHGHPAVARLDFKGIFLAAGAVDFDGDHAAKKLCRGRAALLRRQLTDPQVSPTSDDVNASDHLPEEGFVFADHLVAVP